MWNQDSFDPGILLRVDSPEGASAALPRLETKHRLQEDHSVRESCGQRSTQPGPAASEAMATGASPQGGSPDSLHAGGPWHAGTSHMHGHMSPMVLSGHPVWASPGINTAKGSALHAGFANRQYPSSPWVTPGTTVAFGHSVSMVHAESEGLPAGHGWAPCHSLIDRAAVPASGSWPCPWREPLQHSTHGSGLHHGHAAACISVRHGSLCWPQEPERDGLESQHQRQWLLPHGLHVPVTPLPAVPRSRQLQCQQISAAAQHGLGPPRTLGPLPHATSLAQPHTDALPMVCPVAVRTARRARADPRSERLAAGLHQHHETTGRASTSSCSCCSGSGVSDATAPARGAQDPGAATPPRPPSLHQLFAHFAGAGTPLAVAPQDGGPLDHLMGGTPSSLLASPMPPLSLAQAWGWVKLDSMGLPGSPGGTAAGGGAPSRARGGQLLVPGSPTWYPLPANELASAATAQLESSLIAWECAQPCDVAAAGGCPSRVMPQAAPSADELDAHQYVAAAVDAQRRTMSVHSDGSVATLNQMALMGGALQDGGGEAEAALALVRPVRPAVHPVAQGGITCSQPKKRRKVGPRKGTRARAAASEEAEAEVAKEAVEGGEAAKLGTSGARAGRQRQRRGEAGVLGERSTANAARAQAPAEEQGTGGLAANGKGAGSSKFKGVTRHRRSGRWEAHIWVKAMNKQLYLGGFDEEQQAAEAVDVATLKVHGRGARMNFPPERYGEVIAHLGTMTLEELVMAVRRQSKGFSRGSSIYRGVTAHPSGRWESRVGVPGSKHVYLGLFGQELEAAQAYDRALVRLRGSSAATNCALSAYRAELAEHHHMVHAVKRGDELAAGLWAEQSGEEFGRFLSSGCAAVGITELHPTASEAALAETDAAAAATAAAVRAAEVVANAVTAAGSAGEGNR